MKRLHVVLGGSRWFVTACLQLIAMSAYAETGGAGDIRDLGSELGVHKIGDAFLTSKGLILCLELASGGWIGWYPSQPEGKTPPSPRCEIPPGSRAADALVDFPPAIPNAPIHKDASFEGAALIVTQTEGYTHCGPIFPTSYSVTFADASHREFYIIVKLREPAIVRFDAACDFARGKAGAVNIAYDVVTTLYSMSAGNGRTVIYAWNSLEGSVVLLLVRELPKKLWNSDDSLFVVSQDVLRPKLDAAGSDPRARYQALLSAIGKADKSESR